MDNELFKRQAAAPRLPGLAMLAGVAVVAMLSGCTTPRDSVVVGAIPDDYRTNHPIIIGEKEHKIDLPVGAADFGITKVQKVALGGFLDGYDRSASPILYITAPVGSRNAAAATAAAGDFARFAHRQGIPSSRIVLAQYQVSSIDVSVPVRVSYTAITAQTHKCGRWPDDLITDTSDNKHYADFGCSSQNNLAAQIANPADLLGPRKQTTVDAERRSIIIDDYRNLNTAGAIPSGEVEY